MEYPSGDVTPPVKVRSATPDGEPRTLPPPSPIGVEMGLPVPPPTLPVVGVDNSSLTHRCQGLERRCTGLEFQLELVRHEISEARAAAQGAQQQADRAVEALAIARRDSALAMQAMQTEHQEAILRLYETTAPLYLAVQHSSTQRQPSSVSESSAATSAAVPNGCTSADAASPVVVADAFATSAYSRADDAAAASVNMQENAWQVPPSTQVDPAVSSMQAWLERLVVEALPKKALRAEMGEVRLYRMRLLRTYIALGVCAPASTPSATLHPSPAHSPLTTCHSMLLSSTCTEHQCLATQAALIKIANGSALHRQPSAPALTDCTCRLSPCLHPEVPVLSTASPYFGSIQEGGTQAGHAAAVVAPRA